MRVVLDTNVFISGLLRAGSPPDLLRQAWESRHLTPFTSEWQLDELRRVSRYPRLRHRFAPHEAGRLVSHIRRVAILVEPALKVAVSPDPDDDVLVATAIAGDAQYLVTGDRSDLLALVKVGGVRIVTARQMWHLLR